MSAQVSLGCRWDVAGMSLALALALALALGFLLN
jgi:hypothetical protein